MTAAHRVRRPVPAGTVAALVVLLVSGCASSSMPTTSADTTQAAAATGAHDVLDGSWTIASITTTHGAAVPLMGDTATVRFGGGQINLFDGINPSTAAYSRTSDGYAPSNVMMGGVGIAGTPPLALAAIQSLVMPTDPTGMVLVTLVKPNSLDLNTGGSSVHVATTSPAPSHTV